MFEYILTCSQNIMNINYIYSDHTGLYSITYPIEQL